MKNCDLFSRKKDNNFNLSNMSTEMRVKYGENTWHSIEQLYQACKYSGNAICVPATSVSKKVEKLHIIARSGPSIAK